MLEVAYHVLQLGTERLVFKLRGNFDFFGAGLRPYDKRFIRFDPRLVFAQFPERFVRLVLIVPERGIRGYLFEIVDFLRTLIEVKDTPVAVPGAPVLPAAFLFAVRTWLVS